jgi:hypothetical protein
MSASWPVALRNAFQLNIHALPPAGANVPARHLLPLVASAGKDEAWGIDLVTMAPIVGQADAANDNIYSYRMRRFGARGD